MAWNNLFATTAAAGLILTACTTVPPVTAEAICVNSSNEAADLGYEVLMVSINPKGVSTPTQTISHIAPGNRGCSTVKRDAEDKPLYMTGLGSSGKDIRASALEAAATAPTAAVSGLAGALVNKCDGPNCGGSAPVVVNAIAGATAGATAGMCGNSPCGSSPD